MAPKSLCGLCLYSVKSNSYLHSLCSEILTVSYVFSIAYFTCFSRTLQVRHVSADERTRHIVICLVSLRKSKPHWMFLFFLHYSFCVLNMEAVMISRNVSSSIYSYTMFLLRGVSALVSNCHESLQS